jgi:tetratricopeptide (TPR) repeat protein
LGAPEASRHLKPLEESAARARDANRLSEAERLALDVLELAPGRIVALSILYTIRKSQGRKSAALALIARIVALEPNNFWATNEITLFYLAVGDAVQALRHARNAVRLAPRDAQSHYLLGMALTEAHRPAVGEYHLRRALELSGSREPVVLANLALCLKNQGKMQEGRKLYQEALAASPDNLHILMGFARLEEADRDLAAAEVLLDRAEHQAPGNANVALLRAAVLGRRGDAAAALESLGAIVPGNSSFSPAEYLEKGRLLDRMGRHDEAFAAFHAGKERLRQISGQSYSSAHAQARMDRSAGFFVAARLNALPRAKRRADVVQPLFILGFPRSGTTLLEQSLSAHPRIVAGDELPFVAELTDLVPGLLESPLGYPEALAELWMGDHRDDLDILRDHYLRKVAQLGIAMGGAAWFTDKMPLNETELGFIHLLFPESPLLHVTRHPLDVVLSVFSNLLTHGHYCGYALESAAYHYVRVMDLVDRYRREIELRYLRVRYEDIIDAQEATIRRCLTFIGEDFDAKCLSFQENQRYARTASYAQVTEPLYDRSRYRYRHYLQHLKPVIPILEPVMERLGYTV